MLGCAKITSYKKTNKITATKVATIASIFRKPSFINNNRSKTSNAVIKTPHNNGILKINSNAMAEPIISAISVAIMANSVTIHRKIPIFLPVLARVICAKSIPVTIPKRAAIACNSMAIKFDTKITLIKV